MPAWLVLTIVATPAAAQDAGWTTRAARMDVDFSAADGSAEVRIRYEVAPAGPSEPGAAGPIPFELLGFGEATAERFTRGDGRTTELWPTHGSHRAAAVHPPFDRTGDVVALDLTYRVARAVQVDDGVLVARVPVLAGPVPATGPDAPGFTARLLVPPDWTPGEGFPSGLRRSTDGTAWTVALPVTPSMVGFRGRVGDAGGPGLPLLIDLLTLGVLAVFSYAGWRHLRDLAGRRTP